jgi:BirA family biotin operon repressor/biotin-[acetyl-CoA-carboxylase] ligase
MLVYTDSVDYARTILGHGADLGSAPASEPSDGVRRLIEGVYGGAELRACEVERDSPWNYLFLAEVSERSQYDLLIELNRDEASLPDRVLCLAGAGHRFHGFKGRAWSAPRGNTYLSVHLRPARAIECPAVSFTVLAAVTVTDAIDAMPGLEHSARIKWVNDILIEGAKVGGVLAYTQSVGKAISGAVLGFGVNVETDPDIEPTPFVPLASALRLASTKPEECTQKRFFEELIAALDSNYRQLSAGNYNALLERYRSRSLIIDREVVLCTDDSGDQPEAIAAGRVVSLGDDLELVIEGYDQPFTKGRLVIGSLEDLSSRKN